MSHNFIFYIVVN